MPSQRTHQDQHSFTCKLLTFMSHCVQPPSKFFRENLPMACTFCGSTDEREFKGEIAILKDVNKPVVWVFPEIFFCLDCSKARFVVPEPQLRVLAQSNAAATGAG